MFRLSVYINTLPYTRQQKLLLAGFTSGTLTLCVCDVHVLIDDIVITGDGVPDGGSVQMEEEVKPGGKLTATWCEAKFPAFTVCISE